VGLALAATLLAIRFKISTALSEIVAGTAIAGAVMQRLIANSFLLPRLLHQTSASKKPPRQRCGPPLQQSHTVHHQLIEVLTTIGHSAGKAVSSCLK
jgi:hypothetical protein